MVKDELASSKTAQLWFQYLDMIDIVCNFIKAERTGNWSLHLKSLSGHHLYAKSGYIHLKHMSKLDKSHCEVYSKFVEAYHIVRRSDRFWAGLSSDLIIEQDLLRSIKTTGGLTRGCGMTELQRTEYLLSTPACVDVNLAMQDITKVKYENSEQHKETTKARVIKDYTDATTICRYLSERNPFNGDECLLSLETGEVSDSTVHAHQAKLVGYGIIQKMIGLSAFTHSFKRKDMVVIMKSKSKVIICIDDQVIPVDSQLLFQRLLATAGGEDSDLESELQYELSTIPASLFGKDGLLKEAHKPQLADAIWKISGSGNTVIPDGVTFVLDGGSLLQRLSWSKGQIFNTICKMYVDYVIRKYGVNSIVLCDGYPEELSVKDTAHLGRSKGKVVRLVKFSGSMKLSVKKEICLLVINKTF